jgi:hypothetical protein
VGRKPWVPSGVSMFKRLELWWGTLRGLVDLCNAGTIVIKGWRRAGWCLWNTPLRTRWAIGGCGLICLRMNVLWQWSTVLVRHAVCGATILQKLETCLNMGVVWIKISRSLVGIERISSLIVARLVLKHVSAYYMKTVSVERLTKVPRSYQTSEMFGFRRMARE